ncbi:MAG: MTAP family purine nucleoside phosphorylase, partial [Candidatus Aenigmarchaeota archaeon]|nr:MTAP family purine nucleoside phosphorylase [Candidatus Aenigmarchaeota archaeon]
LATSACGSLKKDIKPGDIVIPDQFVNFTRREDTFYDGPETVHVSSHEPYCSELRKIIFDAAATNGLPAHPKGTVVVIQGPRFSSQAESHFFRKLGFDIVNMTQYPEVMLARELEMCYASVCIVTDYDTGMQDSDVMPVTVESFLKVFQQNVDKIKKLMIDITPKIPEERKCICKNALENAKL